jgi:hypothetical protein
VTIPLPLETERLLVSVDGRPHLLLILERT